MKKLIFLVTMLFALNGYSQFGAKANYVSYNLKVSDSGASYSETVDGFGIGLSYGFDLISIGLDADFLSSDGENETVISPNVMANFDLGDTVGVGAGLSLPIWSDTGDGVKSALLHLPIAVSFNISDTFGVEAGYSISLGDRLEGDGKLTDNHFTAGLKLSF
jgi:hypothetical protein